MKTQDVPESMYNSAMTIVEKNSEYDYYFFDDKGCEDFIKEHYPPTYLICFRMLKAGAAKADLFRWLILYKMGGIYFDVDCTCLKPMRNLINTNHSFISIPGSPKFPFRINHCFLAVEKNNEIIKKSIEYAISNILYLHKFKKDMLYPQDVCGPAVLGKCLNLFLKREKEQSVYDLQEKKLNNGVYIPNINKLKTFCCFKYDNYKDDLKKMNISTYDKNRNIGFDYKYSKYIVLTKKSKLDFNYVKKEYF